MGEESQKFFSIPILVLAGATLVVDGLLLGTVAISLIWILAMPFLIFRGIWAFKNREVMKKRLVAAGILFLAVVGAFLMVHLNSVLAHHRADRIIQACEKYHARTGAYPERLEALVPEYLDRIPSPNVTLLSGGFIYLNRNGRHSLVFAILPPFGRAMYSLDEKKWMYLD